MSVASVPARIQTVSPAVLHEWLESDEAIVVDVREATEHAAERIPESWLVSLSAFDATRLPSVHEGKRLVLHCQSGNRSAKAAKVLLNCGFEEVIHLEGGIGAWKQAGLPVESSGKAPLNLMRQVQIVAGSMTLLGTALAVAVSPAWMVLPAIVGAGFLFAGVTGTCGMATLLSLLPYNKQACPLPVKGR